MNADLKKRVGEAAPTGGLASKSGGEPDQKCESLQAENKINVKAEKSENHANDNGKNLTKSSNESILVKPKIEEMETVKNEEKVAESLENQNEEKDSTNLSEVGSTQLTEKGSPEESSHDPYAYVDRGDFTSEKFKIEIRGLPKFYGYGELKRFLNDKLKLSSHKVKLTRKKSPWIFVCFKNEEDRQAAIKTLNRLTWKGKMLTASEAKPAPDPLVKKRKLEQESGNAEKKPKISDHERLKNSTTPYWNLPYEEQLQKKTDLVKGVMCNLANLIANVNPMLSSWIRRQKMKYNGMVCNLLDIRKSPNCDGYRNKCEFTVGIYEETKERMVGFRLGSYVQGLVGVGPIDSLMHIPQRMKDTVKVFEKFIKASSEEPYNPETHTGHWRLLTLRLTSLGEMMAIVVVNSKGKTEEQLATSRKEVKEFFENGEGKDLKLDSLYFQSIGRRDWGKEPVMHHLLGATHIAEELFGLKFRISPEAFFQVNTPGAGVLYSAVSELIDLGPSTTIVDVCCGTGTIGLSLAKKCGQILGLEVCGPAIEDAKVNASVNNITNCQFFTGRAEEILTSVLTRAKGTSVYAIVDPPRSGLQQKGIIALRGAEVVDKIIYVSCDPNAALKNFVDLARQTSKTYHGLPWVPICAVPVDMFPHTAHCEVVLLFHRINPINMPKSMPASTEDVVLLSKSLEESPSIEPNTQDPEKKDDKGTTEKEKPMSSESTNTKNSKKSLLSSPDPLQGKTFKKVLSGSVRTGRYTQMSRHSPFKGEASKGFNPKSMGLNNLSKINRYEHQRVSKRNFNQDRPARSPRPVWGEKHPHPWLHNEKRNKWKEGESFPNKTADMWKEGLPAMMQDVRMLSENEDVGFGRNRGAWKEERSVERENRVWGGSSPLETRWHGIDTQREDFAAEEEAGRREEWRRGERGEAMANPKRWRDERVELAGVEAMGRRKLEREVEQLLASRRVCLEEGRQRPLPRDNEADWPQSSSFRQTESQIVHEPVWQERRMDRMVEDDRMRIGRLERERSPICDRRMSPIRERQISPLYERRMSPVHKRQESELYERRSSPVHKRQISPIFERQVGSWGDRRPIREELGDSIDRGDRFQGINDKIQLKEGIVERCWNDRVIGKLPTNLDEKDNFRMRRNLDELNMVNEPSAFRLPGDSSLRKPSEVHGMGSKPDFVKIRQERGEIKIEGLCFEYQKPKFSLMERERIALRQSEQTDLRPPYRETQQFPDGRDKILTIHERASISPERMGSRLDNGNRPYRSSDSDFRRPNDVSVSHLLKEGTMVPGQYLNSKERNINFEKKYESNFQPQNFSSLDKSGIARSKMNLSKGDLINRPIVSNEEYGMKGNDSRGMFAPDIFVSNPRDQVFPNNSFVPHKENSLKGVLHPETSPRPSCWNESLMVMRSPSPVRQNERNADMYTHGNFADRSGDSWMRDRDRDEMADWRKLGPEKASSDKVFTRREKTTVPETQASNFSFNLPDRFDKRNLRNELREDSTPSVEKTFSFSLARAAIAQNVQKSEDGNRMPLMSGSNFYTSKALDQHGFSQTVSYKVMSSSNNSIEQMSNKPFGKNLYIHNRPFENSSVQGSLKLSSLDFKQQVPSQSQNPVANFGRGPTSAFTNTTGGVLPWNNVGVSPWEHSHRQPW